jgi:hypothetical protein
MRTLAMPLIAVLLLALAPTAIAEPGVWPDCDPSVPEAMAECSMPPDGNCVQPAIDDFSGLNGGAFVCAASGQWAWRTMTYPEWQDCRLMVSEGRAC